MGTKGVSLILGKSSVFSTPGDTLLSSIENSLQDEVNAQILPLKNKAEGLMIFGSADFPTNKPTQFRKSKYKIFGFINDQDYKQIFISWEENDKYIVEIIDRIVNSIELVKNKKNL